MKTENRGDLVWTPSNHPNIAYFGRVDFSTPTRPAFAFPGVSIRTAFQGSSIDMLLKDYGNRDIINYYTVIVDDRAPTVIAVSPDEACYPLARGLHDGEHTIEVFKRVESSPDGNRNAGKAEFLGFRVADGSKLLPPRTRSHRMEFIGDSITCGYGNELATATPDDFPFTTKNANAYNAFGAIAARTLDSEYLAVAYSGRGMVRNYAGEPGTTLPEMYLTTLPDDPESAKWDISAYTPDVVVINLGTNDFSEGLAPDALAGMRDLFRGVYFRFLRELRGYYPDAAIIAAVGPMLSDVSPPGYNAWTHIRSDVSRVIASQRGTGDDNVHILEFSPQSAPYGEQWHPTVDTHRRMADTLVTFINERKLLSPGATTGYKAKRDDD